MGNNVSNNNYNKNKSREEYLKKREILQEEAYKRFNYRVSIYSYPHHGPYHDYIEWCQNQYELECIPLEARFGHNYKEEKEEYDNPV